MRGGEKMKIAEAFVQPFAKLGGVLKVCRERAGLSQEELAHKLNRTQACISKYENDRKIPDVYTLGHWLQITNSPEVLVAFLYGIDGVTMINQLLPIIGGIALWFI